MNPLDQKFFSRLFSVFSLCFLGIGGPVVSAGAAEVTIQATVEGTDQPWQFTPGGLNSNYAFGVNDGTGPVVLGASDGLDFAQGALFTVTYLSGLVSAGPGYWPYVDANGDPSDAVNGNRGSSGTVAPSYYMSPASYPIYLTELVGTFANDEGAVVGTPFALGVGPTAVVAPLGATELLLGVNDDIFHDNAGAFTVDVSGPALSSVPEPAGITLLVSGLAAAYFYAGRRGANVGRSPSDG